MPRGDQYEQHARLPTHISSIDITSIVEVHDGTEEKTREIKPTHTYASPLTSPYLDCKEHRTTKQQWRLPNRFRRVDCAWARHAIAVTVCKMHSKVSRDVIEARDLISTWTFRVHLTYVCRVPLINIQAVCGVDI